METPIAWRIKLQLFRVDTTFVTDSHFFGQQGLSGLRITCCKKNAPEMQIRKSWSSQSPTSDDLGYRATNPSPPSRTSGPAHSASWSPSLPRSSGEDLAFRQS